MKLGKKNNNFIKQIKTMQPYFKPNNPHGILKSNLIFNNKRLPASYSRKNIDIQNPIY